MDIDEGPPRTYAETCQLASLQFNLYRQGGMPTNWNVDQAREFKKVYRAAPIPRPGQPLIFPRPRIRWKQERFFLPPKGDTPDLEILPGVEEDEYDDVRDVRLAVQEAKEYFAKPRFKFQKPLGYGGLGLALHYRYEGNDQDKPKRDVVVKLSINDWEAEDIREEEKMTRKVLRSAHCIQTLAPEEVDLDPLDRYIRKPSAYDSSDASDSSGDESAKEERPAKKPRREVTKAEREEKMEKWRARRMDYELSLDDAPPRKDYLLLEYVEGGNLFNLVRRLQENKQEGEITRIPNRVLWELWLCLVRACVAMKYPPRKFHAARPRRGRYRPGRTDLNESIPFRSKRWRAKNIVHFDIDPSNIFIGNIEPPLPEDVIQDIESSLSEMSLDDSEPSPELERARPALAGQSQPTSRKRRADARQPDRAEDEHSLVPKLKLADFGLAEDIKRYKRNAYYQAFRVCGKSEYLAPEQFGAEWDRMPALQDGPEVSEQAIAGNYGSATNIWGIALTMWILITQQEPPSPPQPQIPKGVEIPESLQEAGPNPTMEQIIEAFEKQLPQPDPSVDDVVNTSDINVRISYCPLLMDGGYEYVDEELRRTIYECMFHRPGDRPRIELLLPQAREGIRKRFPGEDDNDIKTWVNRYIFDAPIH